MLPKKTTKLKDPIKLDDLASGTKTPEPGKAEEGGHREAQGPPDDGCGGLGEDQPDAPADQREFSTNWRTSRPTSTPTPEPCCSASSSSSPSTTTSSERSS